MRALVTSSNDDGTQQLYQAAPELIIPALRPYRQCSELTTWTRNESVPGYLESRLRHYRYVAIGEFHVHGAQTDAPVVRRVLALARQNGLMLHVHTDADTLERLYLHDPSARMPAGRAAGWPICRRRSPSASPGAMVRKSSPRPSSPFQTGSPRIPACSPVSPRYGRCAPRLLPSSFCPDWPAPPGG
ncbi:MAG: hypothetical protein ACK4TK_03130 [Thiobacillaceae bacterium]